MSESTTPADAIELANASFWTPPDLDALLRAVEPIESLDEFAIEGLTDEEWEAFCSAIGG